MRLKQVISDFHRNFVRPQLFFSVQAWNPWLTKDIAVLEKFQQQATKLVSGPSIYYEERVDKMGLATLQGRGNRDNAIQIFKIMKNMDHLTPEHHFTFLNTASRTSHE